jgi:hypothetical protein
MPSSKKKNSAIADALESLQYREQVDQLVNYIYPDPERLKTLLQCLFGSNARVADKAAWVLTHLGINYPDFVQPEFPHCIDFMSMDTSAQVKRGILRICDECTIPDTHAGKLYDICFEIARSKKEELAPRVFALTALGNISIKYPELKPEVIALIQDLESTDHNSLKARCRIVKKRMSA